MKTTNIIKATFILGLTLSSIFVQATNVAPANTVTPGAERTISNKFKFPTLLIPYSQTKVNTPVKVEVIFTTDKEGKVTYAYAKTRDLKLKQEIEKQFS